MSVAVPSGCAIEVALLLLASAAGGEAPAKPSPPAEAGPDLSWRWDEDAARAIERIHPRFEIASADGGRFILLVGSKTKRLRRLDARGAVVWNHRLADHWMNAAAMAIGGDTLYAALYNGGASGCRVAAFDARSGVLRWETQLQGVGPVAHSAYMNRVQLRTTGRKLTIYGNEAKGRYVEVLSAADGRQLGHRLAGPWQPVPPVSN